MVWRECLPIYFQFATFCEISILAATEKVSNFNFEKSTNMSNITTTHPKRNNNQSSLYSKYNCQFEFKQKGSWSRFSGRKRRKSCLLEWKKNIFPISTRTVSMVHLKYGSEWNFEWRRGKDEEMQLNLPSSKEFAWVGLWITFECLSAVNYCFVFGSASTCSANRKIYWSAGSAH